MQFLLKIPVLGASLKSYMIQALNSFFVPKTHEFEFVLEWCDASKARHVLILKPHEDPLFWDQVIFSDVLKALQWITETEPEKILMLPGDMPSSDSTIFSQLTLVPIDEEESTPT
jgi:hypothetical protein